MSGDTKLTKAEKLFQRLKLDRGFKKEIAKIREQFLIPEGGYRTPENRKKWFGKISRKMYGDLIDAYSKLQRKYKLPDLFCNLLEDYIIGGDNFVGFYPVLSNLVFCELEPTPERESFYTREGWPFVKLLIFEHAHPNYVKKYLVTHKKRIKELFEKKKGKPLKGIRSFKDAEKISRALSFYRLSDDELKERLKDLFSKEEQQKAIFTYKENAVSLILKEKYGMVVSPEHVRKIASKYGKLRDT